MTTTDVHAPHPHDIQPRDLAIETRELFKSFGGHQVLQGVGLQIPKGQVAVILGPSGTGKSVLIRHILGLIRPDAGDVLVEGRDLGQMSRTQMLSWRRDVGVMFQDGALFGAMDVYENVAFPLRQHTDLEEDEVHALVMEHLSEVGLADAAHRTPDELSGGMKKRVGLARALVLEPRIVLCDEPDSGLDPVRTALLGDLLVERHRDLGGTVVVVTHDVALARRISDHVSLLWQGRIVESGPTDEMWMSETPFVRQFLSGEIDGPLGMG
jgi:phospholipid/cholesterol/gamma-HCH transport system ATP-binding protein